MPPPPPANLPSSTASLSPSSSSSPTTAAAGAAPAYPPPVPLIIRGIPLTGAKSRVETQVKLTFALPRPPPPLPSSSSSSVVAYTHVRLPDGTATKRKSRKQSSAAASTPPPSAVLGLETQVYCATEGVPDGSPPGTLGRPVLACASCRTREVKRSQRKMAARVRPTAAVATAATTTPAASDSEFDPSAATAAGGAIHVKPEPSADTSSSSLAAAAAAQAEADRHKIVLFNCAELLDASGSSSAGGGASAGGQATGAGPGQGDLQPGEVQLPARVTCYCRHHREKLGFLIKFTLRDAAGRPIAVGFTPPLMITDDHKSSEKSTEAAARAAAAAAAAVGLPAPQHVGGSPAGARGAGPKALIMPSNPPSGGGAKKAGAVGAGGGRASASAAPTSSAASSSSSLSSASSSSSAAAKAAALAAASAATSSYRALPVSTLSALSSFPSTAATSRTHTHGTTSPSFSTSAGGGGTSSTTARTSTVGTPLPAVLPLPRGTKRPAAPSSSGRAGSPSAGDDSCSSSTSSDTTHHSHSHHHHRKRTTTTTSTAASTSSHSTHGVTPYDRRPSPAGSSLSGASSVLGTPHFPQFALAASLPQMEGESDDEPFGLSLGGFDGGLGGGGGGDGSARGGGGLGSKEDHSRQAFAFSLGGHGQQPPPSSMEQADGEVEAMLFDSLVDYEGGSASAAGNNNGADDGTGGGGGPDAFGADASMDDLTFSPPASSASSASRRETSAWSATSSSDSDSAFGPSTLLSGHAFDGTSGLAHGGRSHGGGVSQHSHWPSIYPSALNNPNHIAIPYPHPYLLPSAPPPPPLPRPSISRVIPSEGPLAGGIEVTLLGVNFMQGMTAFFGEAKASMTSCWNDGTVVCTVPPGVVAGPVPVVLRMEGRQVEHSALGANAGSQAFTYKDASDRALLELALQVVGLKMTGRIEDAKNVALRILGQGAFATNIPTASASSSSPAGSTNAGIGGNQDGGEKPPRSEKTTFERLQSTYHQSVISMTGKSQYALPPLAISTSSTTDEKAAVRPPPSTSATAAAAAETKEKPPSWAAATAAQARRLTEREIARYGHHQARAAKGKGAKGAKYDKMLWFFWLPVLICFAVFFAVVHLPSLVGDAKRTAARVLPFRRLLA